MPHKHVRSRGDNDDSYNLPPTTIAKPLPVRNDKTVFTPKEKKSRSKGRQPTSNTSNSYKLDDTPKAFARLMQRGTKRVPSGLDNGEPRSKKRKRAGNDAEAPTAPPKAEKKQDKPEIPKIMPGEKLSDYSARVDQALPVAGLIKKGKGTKIEGMKERQTKTEKRLHKMYAEWRREEERIREKEEEARELAEEAEEEENAMLGLDGEEVKGKKGKRKRMIGEDKGKDDDPWAELKLKRDAPKGLHDVAQAPPEIKVIPREKFKMRNGAVAQVADVPNAAGSLKRREELGQERKNIIEQYRAMMQKREKS